MRPARKVFALGFFVCQAALADDKALLDALVANGAISLDDAHCIAKNMTAAARPSESAQKLRLYAMAQMQFHSIFVKDNSHAEGEEHAVNGFQLRRLYLGAYANITDDIMCVLDFDLCAGTISNASYLNAVFVSKKFDYGYAKGTAYLGYLKPHFAVEEKTPGLHIYSVDRSMATRYFTVEQRAGSGNVGFGSAYAGIYWDGEVRQIRGLFYGFAATNSQNYSMSPRTSDNYSDSFNFWGNIFYRSQGEFLGIPLNYKIGLNSGYGAGANSRLPVSGNPHKYGEIWGLNPYFELKSPNAAIWAEAIAAHIEYGRNKGAESALPVGVNFCAEYLFDISAFGKIGPIFRYTWLDTDGRGARISDCLAGAQNVDASGDSALNLYNAAQSFYMGVNWYVLGHNLKVQAGYEWAQFNGRTAASSVPDKMADANIFRLQIQMMF